MGLKIGIVGHEEAKFTPLQRDIVIVYIAKLLAGPGWGSVPTVVSGHCHLGGIDIWAETLADQFGYPKEIYPPKTLGWALGYRPRNIQIAEASDIVHNIVVTKLPPDFSGMHHTLCYHCMTNNHVKSGGCWTAKYALGIGKPAVWHYVHPNGAITC